ncbi:hypothetical protein BC828DRAFT_376137 [Blastocladiella britannica]|nr:hypothetical protein BC828DRAFT_376137 [Blastocladiella britannica]
MVWFNSEGFIEAVINNGHTRVLAWLYARTPDIAVDWRSQNWDHAAGAGHTTAIHWAIDHGYVTEQSSTSALRSIRSDDMSVVNWWIARQPSREAAVRALNDTDALVGVTTEGLINVLDWWWTYTGSKLPEPKSFTKIVDAALTGHSLVVIEWWWAHFLEHRTPEHTCLPAREINSFESVVILDWYWQRLQETPELFAPIDDKISLGLIFTIKTRTTLDILQWAVTKCAALDDQRLVLMDGFVEACIVGGQPELLDLALRSMDTLRIHWTREIVSRAVQHAQINVLEWWDRNRDQLPLQNLNCSHLLSEAVQFDAAVDVLAWWYARGFPVTKAHWIMVCTESINHNSYRVQSRLRDHLNLVAPESDRKRWQLLDECLSALEEPAPFTFDFLDSIFPDMGPSTWSPLPEQAYSSLSALFWFCCRANVTVASLLPVEPYIFSELLKASKLGLLEWWLQTHLAADHPMVLPDELDDILDNNDDARRWVRDVVVTRMIPIYVESEEGNELYQFSD